MNLKTEAPAGLSLTPLIDGDIVAYLIASRCENVYYEIETPSGQVIHERYKKDIVAACDKYDLDPENIEKCSSPETLEEVQRQTNNFIEDLIEKLYCPDKGEVAPYWIFLSPSTNFRHALAITHPYKGNRKGLSKPSHHKAVRDHLMTRWGAILVEGVEADDALAFVQCQMLDYRYGDNETVICSTDRDMDQCVGWHYNWTKGLLYGVNQGEALESLWLQMLTGDRTDNIYGLPGIGPVRARQILLNAGVAAVKAYDAVKDAYWAEFGEDLWQQRFNENFELLYLLEEYENMEIYCENLEDWWCV